MQQTQFWALVGGILVGVGSWSMGGWDLWALATGCALIFIAGVGAIVQAMR